MGFGALERIRGESRALRGTRKGLATREQLRAAGRFRDTRRLGGALPRSVIRRVAECGFEKRAKRCARAAGAPAPVCRLATMKERFEKDAVGLRSSKRARRGREEVPAAVGAIAGRVTFDTGNRNGGDVGIEGAAGVGRG